MRIVKAVIAAVGLLGSLAGCYYAAPVGYPMPAIALERQPVPLTRCGRCEEHAAVIEPLPYGF